MADDNFGKWYFDNQDSNVGDIEKRLKNNPEKVNDRDSTTYNTTALMWASLLKRIDIIRWLLDHGAEVNLVDNGNQTALMYAASSTNGDNLPTIQMLIKKGANVDMTVKDGRTALMLESNDTTIRWLINHMSITQLHRQILAIQSYKNPDDYSKLTQLINERIVNESHNTKGPGEAAVSAATDQIAPIGPEAAVLSASFLLLL